MWGIYMSKNIYEDKIVAFVDILGFSSLVIQSHNDIQAQNRIMKALDIIYRHKKINEHFEMEKQGIHITTFSDSVIISYPLPMDGGLFYIFMDLIHLQLELLAIGIFIRGGISIGKVYHDDKNVFGPAVNEAYTLESKIANYPRIILSWDTIKKGINNSPTHQKECDMDIFFSVIKKDVDNWFYLDFLKQYQELDNPEVDYYDLLGKARNYLLQNLNDHFLTDFKVYCKYMWFLNYWNNTIENKASIPFAHGMDEESTKQLFFEMTISKMYPHG